MKDLIFIILIIIFLLICLQNPSVLENWEVYKQKNYKHIRTGRIPLKFYTHNHYRKPYRHPFQFIKSYPIPHLSHN